MSSVGTVVAQRPFRGKNFTLAAGAAQAFPTTVIEQVAAFTGGSTVGNVIEFDTLANATGTSAGQILNGSAALSAGTVLSGGVAIPAVAAWTQLQDMGRHVHVLVDGVKIYTLSRVQLKREATGVTEGINGAGSTGATDAGYHVFYIVTENNLGPANAPGSGGVGGVFVSRAS